MSKVTIKFWNSDNNTYETDDDFLIVESDGNVARLGSYGPSDGLAFEDVDECIEPHYFKDGERIA